MIFSGTRSRAVPIGRQGLKGLAISRRELESILYEETLRLGIETRRGTSAVHVLKSGENWTVRTLEGKKEEGLSCDVAVGADGRFSAFRNAGTQYLIQSGPRIKYCVPGIGWFGVNAEFKDVPRSPGQLSLHFFSKGYLGLLTFPDGTTNAAGLIHSDIKTGAGQGWTELLSGIVASDRELKRLLGDSKRISDWRGVGALPFGRYADSSPYFLAGDAGGVSEPFMGEGIARALGAGPMLYAAFEKGNFKDVSLARAEYARLWKKYYSQRLKIGGFLRLLTYAPGPVWAATRLISSRNPFQEALLSRIHSISR